ncbi:MAG TPA: hypothetical protein VFR56_08015, partial [Actinomycetes bacterium]|nr:hypothetical protein [Actinomycetes bacterium]
MTRRAADLREPAATVETPAPDRALPQPVARSLLLVTVLYLFATSRWGSHVKVPGLPVYAGDVLVVASLVQTAVVVRRTGTTWSDVRAALAQAHLALLLTLAFLGWVALRAAVGVGDLLADPLTGLRDLAPYGYAVVALLAFLVPSRDGAGQRRWVYAALGFHLVWVVLAPWLPGFPWSSLSLGNTTVFESRPDFDSAVLGIAAALALSDVLHGWGSLPGRTRLGLSLFALANLYGLATLLTRAGLLAGIVAVVSVGLAWGLRGMTGRDLFGRRGLVVVLVLACVAVVALLSPPGQRLVGAFGGGDAQSTGTLQARETTWSGVSEYVLSDAVRTAVGVGFGPDFLTLSGTTDALEGGDYENVRSPHNYLVGTFARLGLGGALLAGCVLAAAGFLGLSRLARPSGAVTTVAALTVLTLPVTAL